MHKGWSHFEAPFCPSCEQELGFDVASVENAAPRLDFVLDPSHCGPL